MGRMRVGVGGVAGLVAWGLAAGPSAAARTLPRAEPPPKERACPEMGEGYVRLAGSDTCIKLSGDVRVEGAAIGRGMSLSPNGR